MATNTSLKRSTQNLTPILAAIGEIKRNQDDDRRVREERALAQATVSAQLTGDIGQIKADIVEMKTSSQKDREEIKKITVIEMQFKNIDEWKQHQDEFRTWVSRTFWGVLIMGVGGVVLVSLSLLLHVQGVPGGYTAPVVPPAAATTYAPTYAPTYATQPQPPQYQQQVPQYQPSQYPQPPSQQQQQQQPTAQYH